MARPFFIMDKIEWIINNPDKVRADEGLVILSEVYFEITGDHIDFSCGGCITKAFNRIQKHHYLKSNNMAKIKKAYVLKDGNHQFMAGSTTHYNNYNLSDAEAEWWLSKHPELKSKFHKIPKQPITQPK